MFKNCGGFATFVASKPPTACGAACRHHRGPTVPVAFNRTDLTQPDTLSPVLGFKYITDDQPSADWA
jgi:hypothetical protein